MKSYPANKTPGSNPATTEGPKLKWSAPTVRVMTVEFTKSGPNVRTPESQINADYSPPS